MDSYHIRGARLVYRTVTVEVDPVDITFQGGHLSADFAYRPIATRPVVVKSNRFIDGDIIQFSPVPDVGSPAPDGYVTPEGQCFRLGSGGSTLTQVARGSWLR